MKTATRSSSVNPQPQQDITSPTVSESDILIVLKSGSKEKDYLERIRSMSDFNDKILSNWLNISEKTLRNYSKANIQIKDNIREHILYLWRLLTLGKDVFGTRESFNIWLNTRNFFFDNEVPAEYLNTITGIRFVTDRLTAMEYGDNV